MIHGVFLYGGMIRVVALLFSVFACGYLTVVS
jgi:hypothetical protein